jgi:Fe2+ transport system protein FeoA
VNPFLAPTLVPADEAVPLSSLAVGRSAHVQEARLDRNLAHYLRALGMTLSARFQICQAGDPCIVQVRSTRIGLSGSVARRIFVIPVAD